MLDDDEIRVDSYKLVSGHRVYRMTHLASGIFVDEESMMSAESLSNRLRMLRQRLEKVVLAQDD